MEKLPLDFSQPANRLTAIAEIERKLNEEFNLIEDRRGNYQTTYKKTEEDGE
jgi:hypothetical protein